MKIGALLSVREKASRLPKKVVMPLQGEPLTVKLLKRMQLADGIDQVILATSTHPDDAILAELAAGIGITPFRGSKEDKLKRYHDAAVEHGLDAVVIVDGDDPLCFPEAMAAVAAELRKGDADCIYMQGVPLGAAASGLTRDALERVLEMKDENDTEVWGGYFIGSGRFESRAITLDEPLYHHPEIRLTVDYEEDFRLIEAIFDHFAGRDDFDSREVMTLLIKDQPELAAINREAQQRYEQHIAGAAPVRFKEENQAV